MATHGPSPPRYVGLETLLNNKHPRFPEAAFLTAQMLGQCGSDEGAVSIGQDQIKFRGERGCLPAPLPRLNMQPTCSHSCPRLSISGPRGSSLGLQKAGRQLCQWEIHHGREGSASRCPD